MRDTGNAVDAADDNQAGEYGHGNTDCHRRNIKSQIHGRGDGVGLGRVADETQRDNQGDGEKAGQEPRRTPADFRGQAVRDVKRRAADVFAVADHAVFLRQNGFCKNGRHTQNGRQPHPKNGTRAAGGNRSGYAGNVTGTDLRGNRHGKRLELRQGFAFVVFVFFTEQAAENGFETRPQFGHLRRAQVQGKKQADAD